MPRRGLTENAETKIINLATGQPETVNSKEIFGERIRYYRKKAGLLQQELANTLGITKNAISNWEAGRARPDLELIGKMCEAMKITPSQLFAFPDAVTANERALLLQYRSLHNANKGMVDAFISNLCHVQELEKQNRPKLIPVRKSFRSLAANRCDYAEWDDRSELVYIRADALDSPVDFIFPVNGASMEPTYHDGQMVAVKTISAGEMTPGMIGAFQAENALYIKEYQPEGLISHNPDFPPMLFADYQEMLLIGKVVGTVPQNALATPEEIELYEAFAND